MSSWAHSPERVTKLRVFLLLVIFSGFQLLFTLHLRMNLPPAIESEKIEEFNPKLFEVLSFGQLPAAVDWMWLKSLQDIFITHVKKGSHPAVYYSLDLITELDPAFMPAYTSGATLVSVIRDDGPGALRLVLKGERFRHQELPTFDARFRDLYWSSEWRLPLLLAYIYLFDMDDMPHAYEAFKEATQIPGSPQYVQALVQHLGTPDGRYQVGLRLLDHMMAGVTYGEAKDRLMHRAETLKLNYFLFQQNERFQAFLDARHVSKSSRDSARGMQSLWRIFSQTPEGASSDPWGGHLSLAANGKIVTTTEHRKVFGLE